MQANHICFFDPILENIPLSANNLFFLKLNTTAHKCATLGFNAFAKQDVNNCKLKKMNQIERESYIEKLGEIASIQADSNLRIKKLREQLNEEEKGHEYRREIIESICSELGVKPTFKVEYKNINYMIHQEYSVYQIS